jgi:hypothetical protein
MRAKILVYALPALILTTIQLAEAQQPPTKIPRIGYLIGASLIPVRARHCARASASSGMWRGKPLSLSGDLRKENSIASPRLRQS